MLVPATTGLGVAVLLIARSAEAKKLTLPVAELLPPTGSGVVLLTVAVSLISQGLLLVKATWIVAPPPAGTVINNNATVSSSVSDPNNGNNSATAAVTVNARSDLAITKTSDQASYKPSSVVTYTVSVTNNGPSNALAVIVTDNLPDIQQALYQSDTGGCVANASTPTILTCDLGSMPVGTSKSFNIYELIHGSQGNVSNTASVTSSTTDPNLANNTSVRTVTIGP